MDAALTARKTVSFTQGMSFLVFYSIIILSVSLRLPPALTAGMLFAAMFVHCVLFPRDFLLFPFILYPFKFLIRVPDLNSPILTLLPETVSVLSVLFFIATVPLPARIGRMSKPVFYLVSFVLLTTIIFCFHGLMYTSMYFLVLLRTFILPLGFTLVMIYCSSRNSDLPYKAITLNMISTTIIAAICLLQYFYLYKLPSNEIMFYRTHVAGGFDDRELYESQRSIADIILPRINLLSGGSLGSSAGFFFAIGIIWKTRLFRGRKTIRTILSLVCITAAILSLSFSVLNTLMVFSLIYFFIGKSYKSSIFGSTVFRIMLLPMLAPILFLVKIENKTVIEYVIETYSTSTSGIFNLKTILFGYGIDYFSAEFNIVPDNNIGDIGVFKILFQAGIVSFLLLTLFFYHLIQTAVKQIRAGNTHIKYSFLFLAILVLFLVHQNWIFGSPFFLLFSVSVAGILSAGNAPEQPVIASTDAGK